MAGEGWHRQIDIYCERTDPSFWAEPLNALSNLAFIVAGVIAYRAWRREPQQDWAVGVLILIVMIIGIGSFLFHTFANVWSLMADVIPIRIFIVFYLMLAIRRYFLRPWWLAILIGLAFLPASTAFAGAVSAVAGGLLFGSQGYLPAFLALIVCGVWLRALERPAGDALLVGAGIFFVSLTFRTLDQPLCEVFPLGTHPMWHILNGVLLGWLTLAMLRHGKPLTPVRGT